MADAIASRLRYIGWKFARRVGTKVIISHITDNTWKKLKAQHSKSIFSTVPLVRNK